MSNWNKVDSIDLDTLSSTRKELHKAVQIVGSVPRNTLPHDATDTTASLVWNDAEKGFQSISIPSGNSELQVGLSFNDFSIYILKEDKIINSFQLEGKSTQDGFAWMKLQLSHLGIDSEKINLDLPYEIEKYDYSLSLSADTAALNALALLYGNTHQLLTGIVEQWEKAYDIRCWPHHFDLATLIPIETDQNGEILKSIGVGLSPGDDGINEPYLYVNVWPNVDGLEKHELPAGHWNKEGWSGAVLTYSQLLAQSNQEESFNEFAEEAMKCILKEIE